MCWREQIGAAVGWPRGGTGCASAEAGPHSGVTGGPLAQPAPPRRSRGMTLIELLLVLALLVAAAALSLPAFEGPLEDHQLIKSADLVRAAWAQARIRAMESGRTQVFRYELSGTSYQVQPWVADSDATELDLQTMQTDQLQLGTGALNASPDTELKELPEGISFHSAETATDARAIAAEQTLLTAGDLGLQWSAPVCFYADGTTSTAQVAMTNRRGNFVIVKLRGLTGLAQVGDLLSADEMMRDAATGMGVGGPGT